MNSDILKSFLADLIQKIDSNTLSPDEKQKLRDFYIDYHIAQNGDNFKFSDYSKKDLMKFFTAGYVFYKYSS